MRTPLTAKSNPQQTHLTQARASLRQALSWYSSFRRHGKHSPDIDLQGAIRGELQSLSGALDKLDQNVIRIATFGLVSRGKSAVVNALVGQKVMQVGPLHGVTRWPQSVRWTPPSGKIQLEIVDTPGLDEIEGQERAEMAQAIARNADLILFIVAGDITRTEYRALCNLRQAHKPLLLVFNKIDLYPDKDREAIYQQLQALGTGETGRRLQEILSPDEIITVAAEPAPVQVRLESGDGESAYVWETPPPQIEPLRRRILELLNREGRSLLAINALLQAKDAETEIAKITIQRRREEAEATIWRYARYKAIAVAVNPIAVVDLAGGAIADLALIRSLARLYGLPMTGFEAGKLWRQIIISSGGTLMAELGSALLIGFGKSGAVLAWETPAAIASIATAAALQGSISGYGAYAIGRVTQDYLERGCTWGPLGPSTIIREILTQIEPGSILYRLRQELEQQI